MDTQSYETESTLFESQQTEGQTDTLVEDEEGTPVEESQPTETETKAEVDTGSSFYKPDEFRELLKKSPLHMDRSRVSPEHLDYYDAVVERERAIQADYTRKTQELAEKRKELEAQLSPEEKFYREFVANPLQIRRNANNYIADLRMKEADALEAMDFQKVREIRASITQAENLLNTVEERFAIEKSRLDGARNVELAFQTEIIKDFPDYFSGRQENLTRYLENEGVDVRVQALFANPVVLDHLLKAHGISDIDGVTASKQLIKAVNKAFERANAAVSADKKEIRKPPHTGTSGAGEPSKKVGIEAARERAVKEGDISSWANYLLEKGKVA